MRTDILTIGTEYLTGMVKEMDSFYLAGRLAELDAELKSLIIIGDDPDEVSRSIKSAFENVDMVLVTGACGYGKNPAYHKIFAELFEGSTGFCEEAYSHMKKLAEAKKLRVTEDEIRMLSELPEQAQILINHDGLACGYILTDEKKHLIVLPGGSQEIRAVFEDDVVGYIYKTTSLGEAELTLELDDVDKDELISCLGELLDNENPELSLVKQDGRVQIRIRAVGPTKGDALILAQLTASDCSKRIGRELIKDMRETK